jgi:hypothetical protein
MPDVKKSYCEEILAEASAAVLAETFAYPVHTIWTVQQEASEKQRLSFLKAYKNIAVNGHQQFYKGFSIAAFSAVPTIYLYLFGAKCAITCFGDNHVGQMMQGPFAQAFSLLASAPANRFIELEQSAATDIANNAFKRLSVVAKSKKIWEESGVRGIYRGTFPLFFISAITDGLGFWLRARLLQRFSKEQSQQFAPQLFATSTGFGLAYFFLTPFYAIETRMRLHENNPNVFKDTTFFATTRTLHRQRGCRGFFVGASASAMYGMFTALPVASSGCFG